MFAAARLAGFVALSLAAFATAEDYLVSRRHTHSKRGLDASGNYNISIYHINDVHAHLDEFASSGTDCTAPEKGCYGGYARVKTVIDKTRPTHPDSLFLNAGDESQGTLFYTYYGSEKITETLNQLGFDAMTLGNHEFDRGDDYVAGFIQNVTFPVVCANIQSDHPVLNSTIVPYHYFEKHDLAVVGVTTDTIPFISSPGAGTTFQDPIATVQATVDHIHEKYNKNTKIIAITHIGYDVDKLLGEQTRGIYLVVGGHSHTLLGDMAGAEGPYPTIVKNLDGEEVFVVTSYRWGEYIGYIDVAYDPSGKIVAYTGGPVHLTNTTELEPGLEAQIKEWRKPFEEFAAEVVGFSNVVLDQSHCKSQECLLGDVMADAIMDYREGAPDFAHINGGGVRATIDQGEVTRGEVVTAFPFGNAVVELKFSGADIWKIYEGIVSQHSEFNDQAVIPTAQVSKELRVTWNPELPNGTRLISLEIRGEPVDMAKIYTVAATDFVAGGGDNQMPKVPPTEYAILDTLDEVLVRYLNKTSPITAALEGRISTTNATSTIGGSATSYLPSSTIASSTLLSTSVSSSVSSAPASSTVDSSTESSVISTTAVSTTVSSIPSATPTPVCATPKCPLDIFNDKGALINQKAGEWFQCVYSHGSCTWTLPDGTLENKSQKNCPKVVTC